MYKIRSLLNSSLFIFLIVSIIPFVITVLSIYHGRIAFWFDPARDLLLGMKNLSHPTFVGQPTGIPGVLYPPYWIWFISGILIFSKNPQVVSFLLLTIPYFIIFPFFLNKIVGKWGSLIFGALWFLFIGNFLGYSSQIWNVNLFPLFLIISIYFMLESYDTKEKKLNKIFTLLSGLFIGIASTFHLSLGIPVVLGFVSFNFLLLIPRLKLNSSSFKDSIINLGIFLLGLFFAYTPSLFFEVRHGFLQTKIFLNALTSTALHNTAVVSQKGLTDVEILRLFFERFDILLSLPMVTAYIFTFFILIELFFKYSKKKITIKKYEVRLITLCLLVCFWILFIFLKNSNPVWNYYFIGIEIFFLLIVGFFANKTILGKILLLIAFAFTLFANLNILTNNLNKNNYTVTDLATEKYMVNLIINDAGEDFYYYAYNPAIYTYEYDYLFNLLGKDKIKINSDTRYLLIPKTNDSIRQDFVNYRAPKSEFNEIDKWNIPDGTIIYKMQRINKQ